MWGWWLSSGYYVYLTRQGKSVPALMLIFQFLWRDSKVCPVLCQVLCECIIFQSFCCCPINILWWFQLLKTSEPLYVYMQSSFRSLGIYSISFPSLLNERDEQHDTLIEVTAECTTVHSALCLQTLTHAHGLFSNLPFLSHCFFYLPKLLPTHGLTYSICFLCCPFLFEKGKRLGVYSRAIIFLRLYLNTAVLTSSCYINAKVKCLLCSPFCFRMLTFA